MLCFASFVFFFFIFIKMDSRSSSFKRKPNNFVQHTKKKNKTDNIVMVYFVSFWYKNRSSHSRIWLLLLLFTIFLSMNGLWAKTHHPKPMWTDKNKTAQHSKFGRFQNFMNLKINWWKNLNNKKRRKKKTYKIHNIWISAQMVFNVTLIINRNKTNENEITLTHRHRHKVIAMKAIKSNSKSNKL